MFSMKVFHFCNLKDEGAGFFEKMPRYGVFGPKADEVKFFRFNEN